MSIRHDSRSAPKDHSHVDYSSLTLAQIQAQLHRSRHALQDERGLHSPEARLQEGALYHLQQFLKYDIEKRCDEVRNDAPLGTVALGDDHLKMLYEIYTEAVTLWTGALEKELGRANTEMAKVKATVVGDLEIESESAMSDRKERTEGESEIESKSMILDIDVTSGDV